MTASKKQTARYLAMGVLNRFDPKKSNVKILLEKSLPQTDETQRATDLVFGTIRNRSAIDSVIAKSADCPIERISPKLINIIRVAAYELIYHPQTPSYAVVNEAVDIAHNLAGKKQTAFVNAVLRQITRHIKNPKSPLSRAKPACTLPQSISTGCEFDFEILPAPAAAPGEYLADAFSLPVWLVTGWLAEFGLEKTRQICFASNRRPSVYLRPNTLKADIKALAEKFRSASIDFETTYDQTAIRLISPKAVNRLPGFEEGLFSVQDITAMLAVKALAPRKGWKILDLCAAPGTKTTQLAEITRDKSHIFATDIDPQRLKKMTENAQRLGIKSIKSAEYADFDKIVERHGPFDAVLLDVPCSNTGVMAKRVEVRFRINEQVLAELTKTQIQLLETAAKIVKNRGLICYSTCSLQKCENSSLVKRFLFQNSDFVLKKQFLTFPSAQGFDCDGGYTAVLKKKPHGPGQ